MKSVVGYVFFLILQRPPRYTRTDTRFPDPTIFRSPAQAGAAGTPARCAAACGASHRRRPTRTGRLPARPAARRAGAHRTGRSDLPARRREIRSEEHTSELQSLMRISYAVLCLKKKNSTKQSKKLATT